MIVDADERGPFAVVECDRLRCRSHLALRPAGPAPLYDLVCEAFDWAQDEGWWLDGSAYCPDHWPVGAGASETVADGYAWARVTREPVKGAERRSGPLTGVTARPD